MQPTKVNNLFYERYMKIQLKYLILTFSMFCFANAADVGDLDLDDLIEGVEQTVNKALVKQVVDEQPLLQPVKPATIQDSCSQILSSFLNIKAILVENSRGLLSPESRQKAYELVGYAATSLRPLVVKFGGIVSNFVETPNFQYVKASALTAVFDSCHTQIIFGDYTAGIAQFCAFSCLIAESVCQGQKMSAQINKDKAE